MKIKIKALHDNLYNDYMNDFCSLFSKDNPFSSNDSNKKNHHKTFNKYRAVSKTPLYTKFEINYADDIVDEFSSYKDMRLLLTRIKKNPVARKNYWRCVREGVLR